MDTKTTLIGLALFMAVPTASFAKPFEPKRDDLPKSLADLTEDPGFDPALMSQPSVFC